MAMFFKAERIPKTKLNRLPILPRLGIVFDFAGKRYCYKYVSVIDTLATLVSEGPVTLSNFKRVIKSQFEEIEFPSNSEGIVVDTSATSFIPVKRSNKANAIE